MKLEERLKVLGEKWANLPDCKEANEIADECMDRLPELLQEMQQLEKVFAFYRDVLKCVRDFDDNSPWDDPGACAADALQRCDCGSDYIHRDEVRPLVEALEQLAGYSATIRTDRCEVVDDCVMCLQTEDWCNGLVEKIQHAEQALTHAESLLKGETK